MTHLRIDWGPKRIDMGISGRRGDFVLIASGGVITILHDSSDSCDFDRMRLAELLCMHEPGIKRIKFVRVSEPVQLTIPDLLRELGAEIVDDPGESQESWRGQIDTSGCEDIPF